MKLSLLVLLLAAPARATPAAMSSTLEAIRSQGAFDPSAPSSREDASIRAGQTFDKGFSIQTLVPVEYVAFPGQPRKNPPPAIDETPAPVRKAPEAPAKEPAAKEPVDNPGSGTDYYFEGKKPLNGITIYTPVKGEGSTSGGESPTDKYGKYGKYAMIGGAAVIGIGLLLGGAPLVAAALIGGLLLGAGAVLSFLFGKKK